ncbi:unannotated protein [freshwater metagenome]|uniref:Unannotated protein n=1 Tax=freshwater metagenome TaxID=449393 RepID=A0A6J7FL59_9ZZZZ
MATGGFEHHRGASGIGVVRGHRISHAARHAAKGGEVHDRARAGKRLVERRIVGDRTVDEVNIETIEVCQVAGGEIVEHHHR